MYGFILIYTSINGRHIYIYIYIYIYLPPLIHIYILVHIYIYIYVYMHMYFYVYINLYEQNINILCTHVRMYESSSLNNGARNIL